MEIEYILEGPTHMDSIMEFSLNLQTQLSLRGKLPSAYAFCNAMKGIQPKDCCMVNLVSETAYEW